MILHEREMFNPEGTYPLTEKQLFLRKDRPSIYLFIYKFLACEIFVPQPGIKPTPLAANVQSPNHWTAREFPQTKSLECH